MLDMVVWNGPRSPPQDHVRGQCSWDGPSGRGAPPDPAGIRGALGPTHSLPLGVCSHRDEALPSPTTSTKLQENAARAWAGDGDGGGQGGGLLILLANFVPTVEQNCCKT